VTIGASQEPDQQPDSCTDLCTRRGGTVETKETQKNDSGFGTSVCRAQHAEQRRLETAETHVVWLITQRSRVQIPPPLLISASQGPFPAGRGPVRAGHCCKTCSSNGTPRGPAARRGRWGWHGMRQPGRGGRCRLRSLGASPRGTTAVRRFLPARAGLARTRGRGAVKQAGGCLHAASCYQQRRGRALAGVNNGAVTRAVPMRRCAGPTHRAVWLACVQPRM
jgi:hypothetical protein